ncbi:MAG: hypothetical protein ACKO02_01215, partial [Cyanobium sp.]
PCLALVRAADVLLAPQRLLAELEPWWRQEQAAGRIPVAKPCPQLLASDRPEQIFEPLEQALAAGRQAVLLASGDPLWFGIGRLLLQRLGPMPNQSGSPLASSTAERPAARACSSGAKISSGRSLASSWGQGCAAGIRPAACSWCHHGSSSASSRWGASSTSAARTSARQGADRASTPPASVPITTSGACRVLPRMVSLLGP